jgi:hypothetical protein
LQFGQKKIPALSGVIVDKSPGLKTDSQFQHFTVSLFVILSLLSEMVVGTFSVRQEGLSFKAITQEAS